jgi:hypothetical protein
MKTILAIVVLVVTQFSQVSVFEGDWRTDLPSNFSENSIPAVISGMSFAVTADTVNATSRFVIPGGGSFTSDECRLTIERCSFAATEVFQVDGKPHPSKYDPNGTIVAKWSNPYLLDVVYIKRGVHAETVHSTYSVSADGRTVTHHVEYSANGYVYERTFHR